MLFTNLVSSIYLTGLIWTIQLVHYPSFAFVDPEKFADFNAFHQKAITYIVAPVMVLELGVSLILWLQNLSDWRFATLFFMVIAIWFCTFFLSVPLHNKLITEGYNLETINRLVSTNWPRTILWTARSVALIFLLRNHG